MINQQLNEKEINPIVSIYLVWSIINDINEFLTHILIVSNDANPLAALLATWLVLWAMTPKLLLAAWNQASSLNTT